MNLKAIFIFCLFMQVASLHTGFFGTLAGRLAGRIYRDFTSHQTYDDIEKKFRNTFRALVDPNTSIDDPVKFTEQNVVSLIIPAPIPSPARTLNRSSSFTQLSLSQKIAPTVAAQLFTSKSQS